ncbi:MAG: hypothetical protein U9N34_06185, partial [Candidatus Cloacimonadota bacterium]|nr:hypothetical protein [Candidatus Cloacimonadota bacterium]
MSKKLMIIVTLTILLSALWAEQELIVIIYSNADATGIIYEMCDDYDIYENIEILSGTTEHSIFVADDYDYTVAPFQVAASTSWGANEQVEGSGFQWDGNANHPPSCYIQLSFTYPADIIYNVYSNIGIDNVIVNLQTISNYTIETQTTNFKKGWNEVIFEDIVADEIASWHAEVTAEGVGDETYTIESSTNYDYSNNCYENTDNIELIFDNKLLHSDYNWESFPKLSRTGNNSVSAVTEFESIYPSFTGFDWIGTSWLNLSLGNWIPVNHQLQSSDGGKLQALPAMNRIYEASGTRLSAGTSVNLDAGWN